MDNFPKMFPTKKEKKEIDGSYKKKQNKKATTHMQEKTLTEVFSAIFNQVCINHHVLRCFI